MYPESGGYWVLWVIPADGSPGWQLTGSPPPETISDDPNNMGHYAAYRVGGRTILEWWGDCGAWGLQVLEADMTTSDLDIEPPGVPRVITQAGDNLVIRSMIGENCGDAYPAEVNLIRPDGSLVRTLVPHIDGYIGVASVAGMIHTP
jgi:hypothetical protein